VRTAAILVSFKLANKNLRELYQKEANRVANNNLLRIRIKDNIQQVEIERS
jgi:hypothetical protein